MQYYEAFGLEPKLALDLNDLQKRFYERSRQWHPDKFSRAGAEEQQKALDMTAILNDAFRTLKNPVTRAEYFLKQKQVEFAKEAPTELLEEVFELNMALEELREGDDSARGQLDAAREKFQGLLTGIDAELEELFALYDASAAGAVLDTGAVLDKVGRGLNRRRYVSNLIREVDKELNVHLSN
ncbi:MAG TPA: Fe-S protein assembly co-chaperone HscB [Bryobacteraceae bacterium]|jgi:molecular chaperone HscB